MNELVFKVSCLLCLSFLYLTNSKRINFWYLLALLFGLVSDSLLVFGNDFILQGTIFMLLSRVAYVMVVKNTIYKHSLKTILKYSLPFFITFIVVFSLIYDYLGSLFYPALIIGFISVVLGLLAFLDHLDKNKPNSLYFFLGVFLIMFCDILTAISNFVDEKGIYILMYHILYYAGLYIVYQSMIVKVPNRLA